MGAKNIEQRIVQIIAEHFELDGGEITRDKDLYSDLNADSLDAVDLVLEVEDEFDIAITDEESDQWRTVGDIIDFIEKVTS